MGCYAVPAIAAVVHYFMKKNNPKLNTKHQVWLNQLFMGGAIFGVVDHLWNGELFMLGEKPFMDILLGITITFVILVIWQVMVLHDKAKLAHAQKA